MCGAYRIQQGVPHIVDLHAVAGVEIHLERQDGDEPVHMLAQKAHPAFAPGPELGAYVIDDGNAQRAGDTGHPKKYRTLLQRSILCRERKNFSMS